MSSDHVWYLYTADGQQGPYSSSDLKTWLDAGSITGEWYAWRDGMAEWRAISNCPELMPPVSPVLPPAPPPAPEPFASEPAIRQGSKLTWKDRLPIPSRGMRVALALLVILAAVSAGAWQFYPEAFGLAPAPAPIVARKTPPLPLPAAPPDTTVAATEAESTGESTVLPTGPPRPFLWKVESPDAQSGARPSWLFGTMHVADSRIVNLPASVRDAIRSSGALFTEIPMDMSLSLSSMQNMTLPGDKTLKDIVPPDLYGRLSIFMRDKGTPIETFGKFKIWAIAMMLQQLDEMKRATDRIKAGVAPNQAPSRDQIEMMIPLDMKLYTDAVSAGKKTGGLETIHEQFGVLDALTITEQVAFLKDTLDKMEEYDRTGKNMTEEMIRIYLRGDLEALYSHSMSDVDPDDPMDRKFLRLLIFDRNVRMTDRIVEKLKKDQKTSHFFAVGAAHYPGDSGIVSLLRSYGYTVTRVEN